MVDEFGNFKYEYDNEDDVKRVLRDVQVIYGGGNYYGFWYLIAK